MKKKLQKLKKLVLEKLILEVILNYKILMGIHLILKIYKVIYDDFWRIFKFFNLWYILYLNLNNIIIGSYYLIYFGFVNCPDICPLTMHKLNKAMEKIKKLPENSYFDIKALFISVDPERDSNEKIKK